MDMCFELAGRIVKALGAVTVVDETHGFRFFDNRDLLGFVDGTENPKDHLRCPPPRLVTRIRFCRRLLPARAEVRARMDSWDSLSVTEQSW